MSKMSGITRGLELEDTVSYPLIRWRLSSRMIRSLYVYQLIAYYASVIPEVGAEGAERHECGHIHTTYKNMCIHRSAGPSFLGQQE